MPRKPLTSPETMAVLRVLVNAADKDFFGYEIARLLSRPRGPVYRTLHRLEAANLLSSDWDPGWDKKGPRRKLYSATTEAVRFYEAHMASVNYVVRRT